MITKFLPALMLKSSKIAQASQRFHPPLPPPHHYLPTGFLATRWSGLNLGLVQLGDPVGWGSPIQHSRKRQKGTEGSFLQFDIKSYLLLLTFGNALSLLDSQDTLFHGMIFNNNNNI